MAAFGKTSSVREFRNVKVCCFLLICSWVICEKRKMAVAGHSGSPRMDSYRVCCLTVEGAVAGGTWKRKGNTGDGQRLPSRKPEIHSRGLHAHRHLYHMSNQHCPVEETALLMSLDRRLGSNPSPLSGHSPTIPI